MEGHADYQLTPAGAGAIGSSTPQLDGEQHVPKYRRVEGQGKACGAPAGAKGVSDPEGQASDAEQRQQLRDDPNATGGRQRFEREIKHRGKDCLFERVLRDRHIDTEARAWGGKAAAIDVGRGEKPLAGNI